MTPIEEWEALHNAVGDMLTIAEAATPGEWAIWRDLDYRGFFTVGDVAGVIPEGEVYVEGESNPTARVYVEPDAAFIAAHHPALMIRAHREALERLNRHRPTPLMAACIGCDKRRWWSDCPEIVGLRSVYMRGEQT